MNAVKGIMWAIGLGIAIYIGAAAVIWLAVK
jgi:hypothetical protein